ncbi:MAG: formate dehydrogenase subunit delta [Sphingomonadaceae bacterium]|nr:formate dehydrogenase subunit delta [Sphingomonadaceae bacterium]
MAQQIARNFAVLGEAEAAAATADHIAKFWDPRMKAQLLAEEPGELPPVVALALEKLAFAGQTSKPG